MKLTLEKIVWSVSSILFFGFLLRVIANFLPLDTPKIHYQHKTNQTISWPNIHGVTPHCQPLNKLIH